MAKMDTDQYRGVIKKAEALLSKTEKYMNETNTPMIFFDDIDALNDEVSEKIGELKLYIKSLPAASREKYQAVLDELEAVREELKRTAKKHKQIICVSKY